MVKKLFNNKKGFGPFSAISESFDSFVEAIKSFVDMIIIGSLHLTIWIWIILFFIAYYFVILKLPVWLFNQTMKTLKVYKQLKKKFMVFVTR